MCHVGEMIPVFFVNAGIFVYWCRLREKSLMLTAWVRVIQAVFYLVDSKNSYICIVPVPQRGCRPGQLKQRQGKALSFLIYKTLIYVSYCNINATPTG